MNVSKVIASKPFVEGVTDKLNLRGAGVLINGEVLSSANKFVKRPLFFNNGQIIPGDVFEKQSKNLKDVKVVDLEGKYVTPAILDQHIHGGYGIDFNHASEEEIRNYLRETKKWGYGGILATLVPDPIEKLNSQMDIIRNVIKNPDKNVTEILGISLEGPFFSPKKAGIHPLKVLMKPTVDNLKKLNLENVSMVTISPELDEGYKATEYLNSLGIITSAGHSAASAEQVRDSNVKQITHLFNAMSGFHHRIPTIANEGLMNDRLYVEVNSARELLDPKTIDLVLAAKPDDKVILISDALSGTNIKDNFFIMGGKRIDIDENGIAKDKDGVLAGSIKLLGQVAKQLVDSTKMSFEDFIKFSSTNPAKNLGVEKKYNMSEKITIWDKKTLLPEKTLIKGE